MTTTRDLIKLFEQFPMMLCDRKLLEFSSSLQATSVSVWDHINVPSSDLRSDSSVVAPSSCMSAITLWMIRSEDHGGH